MVKREEETTKNSLTKNECLINIVSHLRVSTVQEWTRLQMNPETGCREQVCGKRAGSDRCCLGVRMARIHFPKSFLALLRGSSGACRSRKDRGSLRMPGVSGTTAAFGRLLKGFVVVSVDSFSDQFLKI